MQVVVEDDTDGEALVTFSFVQLYSITLNYVKSFLVTFSSIQLHSIPFSYMQFRSV